MCYLIPNNSAPNPGGNRLFPRRTQQNLCYFVAFVRAFYLTGPVALPKRNKIRLVVAFAFLTLFSSFQLCYS